MLAGSRPQREQALLDALELARIVVGGAQRLIQMAARIVEGGQGGVERFHRRLDQGRRLRRAALQPAQRSGNRRHGRCRACHRLMRIAQVARHLLRLHHGGAPFCERGFFRGLRSKLLQFVDRVAKKIGLALRPLDLGAQRRHLAFARTQRLPQAFDLTGLALEAAEGIEQAAMRRRIHERALVVLAVDLDQRRAQRPRACALTG